MRRRTKIAWSLAALLLVLAGLELFCRFYLGLGDPPLSRADPEIEYLFVGPRTYHRFGNIITYNTFSMRSREFAPRRKDPNELRIMFCGDSVINGGSLTDQRDLATERMEKQLGVDYHRPAIVMNVSAGSWGPPNYWAYVRRYGIFESNVLVIVVSSHDAADAPTFEPVVGISPDMPDRTPTYALGEAIQRYAPRYLPFAISSSVPTAASSERPKGAFDQSMGAFRDLIHFATEQHVPVVVAQHLEADEYDKPETEGHRLFREAASDLHVPIVELATTFQPAMKSGKAVYRDPIHLSAIGQELMLEALYPEVVKYLATENITPRPASQPAGAP